jgi:SAM-dependent methyltransferase
MILQVKAGLKYCINNKFKVSCEKMTTSLKGKGWTQVEECHLCGSKDLINLHTNAIDRHYRIAGDYTISKCSSCTLVFLNPMPDDSILVHLYPEDFYAYQDFEQKPSWLKQLILKILLPSFETRDPTFSKPGKVLDIGCGSGEFLAKMRDLGWETNGVEVSSAAAKLGNERFGLDIFTGSLLESSFPDNYFDYIRSNHSLEHIYNPNQTIAEIHRILKPGGKVHIGVPNINSFNAKMFGEYWWYLGAPVHTFNYSVKTLTEMLKKHGFTSDNIFYNSNRAGIIGSIQIYLNRNSGDISTNGWLLSNKILIFLGDYIAKIFDFFGGGDSIEITFSKDINFSSEIIND